MEAAESALFGAFPGRRYLDWPYYNRSQAVGANWAGADGPGQAAREELCRWVCILWLFNVGLWSIFNVTTELAEYLGVKGKV